MDAFSQPQQTVCPKQCSSLQVLTLCVLLGGICVLSQMLSMNSSMTTILPQMPKDAMQPCAYIDPTNEHRPLNASLITNETLQTLETRDVIPIQTTQEEMNWCANILSHFEQNDKAWIYTPPRSVHRKFASQKDQDWLAYTSMFRNMSRQGIYVDLAANDPREFSNTYFLDKCLGWKGLCIEANPHHVVELWEQRSCQVVDRCIWEEVKEMTFQLMDKEKNAGLSGLMGLNKINSHQSYVDINMTCSTLQIELDRLGIHHVDYLSLDIEGSEYYALKAVDFNRVQIDVIAVEVGGTKDQNDNIIHILEENGFEQMDYKIEHDALYIHRTAEDKMVSFKQWLAEYREFKGK